MSFEGFSKQFQSMSFGALPSIKPMSFVRGELRIISNDQVEWRVPDLDTHEMTWGSEDYKSPEFEIGGKRWELWIYPDMPETGGYIVVSLRSVSPCPINIVQFSLSLKMTNGQQEYESQEMAVFRGRVFHNIVTQLSLGEYSTRKSELCSSGYFTIICRVKILYEEQLCRKFNKLKKKYEDSQLKLKETEKEKTDIKEELDACKVDRENISKENLCLKDDLKAMIENLETLTKNLNHLKKKYDNTQPISERTVKEEDDKKEFNACTSDKMTRENWGKTLASASSKSCDHDKILRDFKQLLLNHENSDVLLRVRGQEFQVHRTILAARSPVFASTFQNDMKEKEIGIIDIEDCDPSSFLEFLSFIYSNDVSILSEGNMFHLFMAADKYDVMELRTECLKYMKENMSLDTFCETLTLSLQLNKTELMHLCTDFFVKNAEEILETVKWQMFATENPIQSNELFIKYVKSMKQSNK